MEPPKGFASNLWSLWTDGFLHTLELYSVEDITPFLTELGKQARKRYRAEGLAEVALYGGELSPRHVTFQVMMRFGNASGDNILVPASYLNSGIGAFKVHIVPTKETQN